MFEPLVENLGNFETGTLAAILSILAGILFLVILVLVAVYVYTSLAFMAIGKKAKLQSPGIAWIPILGPELIAFQASKMHWWPWLLLSGIVIGLIPLVGWFLGIVALIVFSVFTYIWTWKMFEVIGKPGWWALVPLLSLFVFISSVGWIFNLAGSLGFLVLVGIAAWSKE